jgi:hypothetical protein
MVRALRIIAAWGPEGIDAVLNTMWVDYLIPVGYGLLMASFFSWIVRPAKAVPKILPQAGIGLPILAIVLDYLENILETFMLSQGWLPDAWLLLISSSISLGKWLCVLGSLGLIVYAGINYNNKRRSV